MFVLFEESNALKAGRILNDSAGNLQVELPSGKRSKVKANQVYFNFDQPEPSLLLTEAHTLAATLDIGFLWECAPQAEFDFISLAAEYFSQPNAIEKTALLIALQSAPIYFYRKGRGQFRSAPPDTLQAALQAVARKEQQRRLQEDFVAQMQAGVLPDALRATLPGLLFKPDKNSLEYKALDAACQTMQIGADRLLLALGGFADPYDLHYQRFLHECFPRGPDFPDTQESLPDSAALPLAACVAFSIDDSTTTEIDDAFSVEKLPDGWRIGIHIAAPGAIFTADSAQDKIARARLSTVYMPGSKITMLPPELIDACTLAAGRTCAALSLYLDVDSSWKILRAETRLNAVPIHANLRHDELDAQVTEESLAAAHGDYPFHAELAVLWQFAQTLSAQRAAVRGKPENNNRLDYNFYVDLPADISSSSNRRSHHQTLGGDAVRVRIVARPRQAPLDRLVAELMILANSTWGKLLADHGVAGIYRAQQNYRTRMQTKPAPHEGLGVAQYAWSTSPLRRYPDLVNQWQILSVIQQSPPVFSPGSAELFSIVSAFEAAYASYNDFQNQMERYWCLRWLSQEKLHATTAVIYKDDLVRLSNIPLFVRVPDLPAELRSQRGKTIEIALLAHDLVDLSVQTRFMRTLQIMEAADNAPDEGADDEMDLAAPEIASIDQASSAVQ